jgi:carbonic anhydrase
MIDQLLKGNEQFRNTVFKDNIQRYNELAKGQKPSVLWIGCSDSRIQTGHITSAQPGVLFIQRNIGNVAPVHDWNFATVLYPSLAEQCNRGKAAGRCEDKETINAC